MLTELKNFVLFRLSDASEPCASTVTIALCVGIRESTLDGLLVWSEYVRGECDGGLGESCCIGAGHGKVHNVC